jgi:hypothetical protein
MVSLKPGVLHCALFLRATLRQIPIAVIRSGSEPCPLHLHKTSIKGNAAAHGCEETKCSFAPDVCGLNATDLSDLRASCVSMHSNKVHHVTTINRVAEDLGEDEDWLRKVANEMDAEDGLIWVYGVGEDGVMAFTDFGIETLRELIRIHKENPELLGR